MDLSRQLEEAKERESTLLAVERQHKADAASLTAQMNAAEQRGADTEHRLALMSTDLKVSPIWILPTPLPPSCCSHNNSTNLQVFQRMLGTC